MRHVNLVRRFGMTIAVLAAATLPAAAVKGTPAVRVGLRGVEGCGRS